MSYEDQQFLQMMRFADYFARAFSSISASQFPWTKMLKESTVAEMTDVSFLTSLMESFEIKDKMVHCAVIFPMFLWKTYLIPTGWF